MFNFSFVVPGRLAGCGRPGYLGHLPADLQYLQSEGIRAILGFVEHGTMINYNAALPSVRFHRTLRLELEDHTAPPDEMIVRGLEFIDQCLAQSWPVAVHCLAGIGRTGTLLACYLARESKVSGAEAIALLREVRPESIETEAQLIAVHRFAARYCGLSALESP